MQADVPAALEIGVERAVLAVGEFPPDFDIGVVEYGFRVKADHAHDRLIRGGNAENRLHVAHAGAPARRNRLRPGLKMTFPSTTTSSSSRNRRTAFESVLASRSIPLAFTSSTVSAPTLIWKTSCRMTGP